MQNTTKQAIKQKAILKQQQLAIALVKQHASNTATSTHITQQQVSNLLSANNSATIAHLQTVTNVKLAAQNKQLVIKKVAFYSVMLANNAQAYSKMYLNKVQKTATQHATNNANSVQNFVVSNANYTHINANCNAIVQHNNTKTVCLIALLNNSAKSYYVCAQTNSILTKQQVAALSTKSAAKQILNYTSTTHNKTNNVVHNAQVRTITLSNVMQISANKCKLTAQNVISNN